MDKWDVLRITLAVLIASAWLICVVGHMIRPDRIEIPYTVQIAMAAVVGFLFTISKGNHDG